MTSQPVTATCGLVHHAYDDDVRLALHLEGGRNMGLGINLLRARIDDDQALTDTVLATAEPQEVVASTIELALMMASTFCGPMLSVTNQDAGRDPQNDALWRQMEMVTQQHKTVVFLLNLAMNFHDDALEHISGCTTCAANTVFCPLAADEQLVRDMADAIASQAGHEITRIVVDGVSPGHALDIAATLAEATRSEKGFSYEEQLSVLSTLPSHLAAVHAEKS